jgi:broad specificity phosphatase PhoE
LTERATQHIAAEQSRPARLWLVRHAQASFGSDDYDRLSERGEQQAERLARWLAADTNLEFAHVVAGTLRRHQQTLAPIAQAFAAGGRALPTPHQDPDWNEFQHDAVIRAWATRNPQDARLVAAHNASDRPTIHALLAAALHAWAAGELDGDVPETWTGFGARVARARARLDALRGRILVISSGGPIARCAQHALGCDAQRAVKLNLALRNTAVSEFRCAGEEWDMAIWNMLPHLPGPADRGWVTYY